MRLKNYTDISNEKLRDMIQFVKPNGISDFKLTVYNSKEGWGCGKACPEYNELYVRLPKAKCTYPYLRDNSKKRTRVVKLYWDQLNEKTGKWEQWYQTKHIALPEESWKSKGGYIPCLILSREESTIYLLAHELRHLWQYKHKGKRGRVWGARGLYSERDTCAYAIRKTREWRKLHTVDVYVEQPDQILIIIEEKAPQAVQCITAVNK
jgi:hypothetical protein